MIEINERDWKILFCKDGTAPLVGVTYLFDSQGLETFDPTDVVEVVTEDGNHHMMEAGDELLYELV